MKCSECKHWETPEWYPAYMKGLIGTCCKPTTDKSMLLTDDYSKIYDSEFSYIDTGKDFGCIHFEQK